jgi:hypothetical protein
VKLNRQRLTDKHKKINWQQKFIKILLQIYLLTAIRLNTKQINYKLKNQKIRIQKLKILLFLA